MNRPLIIVSGRETSKVLNALEQSVTDQGIEQGLDCLLIPHLYHVSESSKVWKKLAELVKPAVMLCWLHPRPAEWLLRRHHIDCEGLTILNLGGFPDANSVVGAVMNVVQKGSQASTGVKGRAKGKTPAPGTTTPFVASTRPRWYPVVDGSRCVTCQHCLQFCLFGVYALDARGHVEVRNPDQCKAGCPACSRICPQSAIMFPLYEKDAAIAGAPGQFVALDAAARKMFYTRTKQPCPVCGQKANSKSRTAAAQGNSCPECGCPRPVQTPAAGAAPSADRLPFDDLDDLVDRLDQQMQRRG